MITGFDSVVLAAARPGPALGRFLERWGRGWPDMRVSAGDPARSPFVTWRDERPVLPEARGEVLVARDERMLSDWDEHGYEVPGSSAGPFALLYEPCPAPRFPALAQEDPYARGALFDPYQITIVGAALSLVTIVTPDEDSEFSRRVIDGVIDALAAQGGRPTGATGVRGGRGR
ncbi:hypothetical protein AB0425_12810 [Actinosynnema sp. NPDC051121]|nr:hypothetical protein [Saccharothrix sp.]